MRIFITAVSSLFTLSVLLASDTATDFSKRYGPPVSETYLVRPGIVATVSYGKSGHACEIVVGPNQSGAGLVKSRNVTIESQQLTEVLDEIVPAKEKENCEPARLSTQDVCPATIAMEVRRTRMRSQFIVTEVPTKNTTQRFNGIVPNAAKRFATRMFRIRDLSSS